jgi:hypothetical protein
MTTEERKQLIDVRRLLAAYGVNTSHIPTRGFEKLVKELAILLGDAMPREKG